MSKSNRKIILESDDINRKIVRISHEIIEKNINVENLLLVGILSRGVPIAKRIRSNIKKITSKFYLENY